MTQLPQQWLFRTARGPVLRRDGKHLGIDMDWNELVARDDLAVWLAAQDLPEAELGSPLAPTEQQEVWGAGVTYLRSRTARQEEAQDAGGGDFYERVYDADRPELFFKATPHRVAGHGGQVRIRRDSTWNVPEPELGVLLSASGKINGYTVGNDMSSRSIEGENPLYLPQAKTYDGCCGLGPGIYVTSEPLPDSTEIRLRISRGGADVMSDSATLAQMKRRIPELVGYLTRECTFPDGCFLLTGTGIVPGSDFTLASGDVIEIAIDLVGVLINSVA